MRKKATSGTTAAGTNQVNVCRGDSPKQPEADGGRKRGRRQFVDGRKDRKEAREQKMARAIRAVDQDPTRRIRGKQDGQRGDRVVIERDGKTWSEMWPARTPRPMNIRAKSLRAYRSTRPPSPATPTSIGITFTINRIVRAVSSVWSSSVQPVTARTTQ